MEKRKKTVYTAEFKRDAVNLAESSSKPATQVARELGISVAVLRNWIYDSRGTRGSRVKQSENLSLEEKIKAQEKEIAELRMEKEILKRFSAFWVKETSGK